MSQHLGYPAEIAMDGWINAALAYGNDAGPDFALLEPRLVAALRSGGYEGYYDIELVGLGGSPDSYPELLAHSRDAFERLSAVHARGE